MAAADGKAAPPPDLQLAFLCGEHNLPDDGGVFDQDYRTLNRMRTALSVYRTVSKFRGLTGNAVNTELSASERVLLGELTKMGILKGGLSG